MIRSALLLLASSVSLAFDAKDSWAEVDSIISQYKFLPDVSFSAGNASGRLHTFTKGALDMQTPNILASSSKFPAAMAIVGAVSDPDNDLHFTTKVNEVFHWWTFDPADVRSAVTLHHLLTFTSGMVTDDFGGCGLACLDGTNLTGASEVPSEACAFEIFAYGPWNAVPGTVWSYHSAHLQLAGAMAAKATGMSIPDLMDKYLLKKLGMMHSFWTGNRGGMHDPNPHLAAALVSTGDDYDKMLNAVLTYKIASKEVMDIVEEDAYRTYPGLVPGNNSKDLNLEFYGHYSMCLYFECVNQMWSDKCERAAVHSDPGYFGYWPLINRAKGYYMQLVVHREVSLPEDIIKKYHVSPADVGALAAQCVSPLRFNLSNPVEKALGVPLSEVANYTLPYPLDVLCDAASPSS